MATVANVLPRPRRRPRHEPVSGRANLPDFYTVKRIDNSRLRREVNPQQRREFLVLLGLSAVIFFFVFLFSWQHFQCVRYGYQIEQLKLQRADLEEWNDRLRVEEASLADPQRIDALARQSGLASPSPQQIIRVGSGEDAPSTDIEMARSIAHPSPPAATITGGH